MIEQIDDNINLVASIFRSLEPFLRIIRNVWLWIHKHLEITGRLLLL